MNYKVSVIVPVYNTELYLKRCLNSIISQTYKNLEIICVNDGSTDNSQTILEEFAAKDSRIKIIVQKNGGLSAARNTGIRHANGDFISFIDSDDEIERDAYQYILQRFSNDIDIVFFGTKIKYDSHYELKNSDDNYYKIKFYKKTNITDDILLNSDCSAWNKLYRTKHIIKNNVFFPEGLYYEDYSFYWKLMPKLNNIYFIKKKLYIYHRRENSIMSNSFDKKENTAIQHIFILDTIYEYWKKNNMIENRIKIFESLCLNCFWFAINNSPRFEYSRCIWEMTKRLRTWSIYSYSDNILNCLKNGNYHFEFELDTNNAITYTTVRPLKTLERIFCIRNEGRHKVIRLFGIKIASKRLKI